MNNCFYNDFSGGNSFAIDLGIGTGLTLENTVKKYDELGGFDCGIFATDILIRVLFENGHADLAYKLLTSHKEKASYGYMMDCGATTLWEYMTGKASHNHPMFGACVSTFFKYILGIRQEDDSYGYEKVVIAPCYIKDLKNAKGYITTPKGRVSVIISHDEKTFKINALVPKNQSATAVFGGKTVVLSPGENVLEFVIE